MRHARILCTSLATEGYVLSGPIQVHLVACVTKKGQSRTGMNSRLFWGRSSGQDRHVHVLGRKMTRYTCFFPRDFGEILFFSEIQPKLWKMMCSRVDGGTIRAYPARALSHWALRGALAGPCDTFIPAQSLFGVRLDRDSAGQWLGPHI